jgi:hypothetical protein
MGAYLDRLDQAVDFLVMLLKLRAPKKSGTLAMDGIRKMWDPSNGLPYIVIGGEPAPYAIYTNEPWISDRWFNKRTGVMAVNPNQGWVQQTCLEAKPTLIAILSGTMDLEEYYTLMNRTGDELQFAMQSLSPMPAAEVS